MPEQHPDPNVRELARVARASNAFVLASPVYHASYTGVLKNALDSLGDNEFEGKPVGLVGHKGVQPIDHLRIVVRSLGAYAIMRQVITKKDDFVNTAGGYVLESETLTHRINVFCDELLDWVRRFRD
jgi:NAD(P)H-dependent FMN reductase